MWLSISLTASAMIQLAFSDAASGTAMKINKRVCHFFYAIDA